MILLAYNKVMEFWERLSPYHPELLAPAFMGLVMCFFGGSYMTLIAAVEAYRQTGWESTYNCVMDLYHDFQKVRAASQKVSFYPLPPPSLQFILPIPVALTFSRFHLRMTLLMTTMMESQMFNKLLPKT
jgi:hypothetical protein